MDDFFSNNSIVLNKYEKILILYLFIIYFTKLFYLDGEGIILGGLTLWYSDLGYIIILLVLIISAITNRVSISSFNNKFFLSLFLLVTIIGLIDLIQFGIRTLGNMRAYFPILITLYIAAFIKKEKIPALIGAFVKLIVPFIIIALILVEPKSSRGYTELRDKYQILNASFVLVIGVLFFSIILMKKYINIKHLTTVSIFFFLIVVTQQHRSVWVFFIVAYLYYILSNIKYNSKYIIIYFFIGFWAITITFLFYNLFFSSNNIFIQSFINSFQGIIQPTKDPTAEWRIKYFTDILGIVNLRNILGWGFFNLPKAYISGQVTDVSAHNMYLAIFMNLGIFGLLIFIMYYINLFRTIKGKIQKFEYDTFEYKYYVFLQCVLLGFLFYGTAYSLEPAMFLIFGLAEL